MGTVIWVMMAVTTHSWAIPAMEFNSKERCEAAVVAIEQQTREHSRRLWSEVFCVKVEK